MTAFAIVYFGLAWTFQRMFVPLMHAESSSPEQEVGAIASIAGFCAGLGLAMFAVSNWLKRNDGRPDVAVIVIGWLVIAPIVAIVLLETFEIAYEALIRHGTMSVLTVLIYACVLWLLWRTKG